MIQEDGVVHAYAFDTFMCPSPPPPLPQPPTHYSHGTSTCHPITIGQIWSKTSPSAHTNAAARLSANITARINRLTPNRNIKQQNLKRWKGREGRKAVRLRRGKAEEGTPVPPLPARRRRSQPILPSFFFCLRGGVTGRPAFIAP